MHSITQTLSKTRQNIFQTPYFQALNNFSQDQLFSWEFAGRNSGNPPWFQSSGIYTGGMVFNHLGLIQQYYLKQQH